MLYAARKYICTVCIVILYSVLTIRPGICSAHIDNSPINQEALWISLDLPLAQRKQIDAIIVEAYKQVKVIQNGMVITDLSSFANLYKLGNYMNQMGEIQDDTNSRIMQVLTPEQRNTFESRLDQKKENTERYTAQLLALSLSDTQEAGVVNMMLQVHKRTWSIIADQSLSWEKRRAKVQRLNVAEKISTLLTKAQLNPTAWMF